MTTEQLKQKFIEDNCRDNIYEDVFGEVRDAGKYLYSDENEIWKWIETNVIQPTISKMETVDDGKDWPWGEIEQKLLQTITGNGLEIHRFINWLKQRLTHK